MKKHLTTLFMFAATMLVTLTFTACGEEVNIDGPNTPVETKTVFTSIDDDTRTSIDNKRWFMWEPGDKIWVKNGGTWIESNPTDITSAQSKAKFVFNENLTDPAGYTVAYTGKNATSATTVTIANVQNQTNWNDGSHIGVSGDCGVATAHKIPGGYQFRLEHKAAYLLIYPYMGVTGNYKLKKIEIFGDGQHIAGTFDFGPNVTGGGLADIPVSGTSKDSITLNLGTSGLDLDNTVPDLSSTTATFNHCFIVIAPGTHELTFKYTVENSAGEEIAFIKDQEATKYDANGVYTFVHELKTRMVTHPDTFYEKNSVGYPWGGAFQSTTYNTGTTELTGGSWGTLAPSHSTALSYTRNMPYWDNATEWKYVRTNGTTEVRRGGAWIKKAAHTTAPYTGSSSNPPIIGRPDATELDIYFFLPAFRGINVATYFWTRTPSGANTAYSFDISKAKVGINSDAYRHNPFTPWKQIGNGAQTWWE